MKISEHKFARLYLHKMKSSDWFLFYNASGVNSKYISVDVDIRIFVNEDFLNFFHAKMQAVYIGTDTHDKIELWEENKVTRVTVHFMTKACFDDKPEEYKPNELIAVLDSFTLNHSSYNLFEIFYDNQYT